MTPVLIGALGALFGLIIGPFLGIAVDRMVDRERPEPDHRCAHRDDIEGTDRSLVVPCKASLGGWASLVPVLGWRATCPLGHGRSGRYALTDLATAATLGAFGWRFHDDGWLLAVYAVFGAAVVVLAVIDLETKLLVNIGTYPLMAFMAFAVLVVSGNRGEGEFLNQAIVGGTGYTLFFGLMFLVYPAGLGLGDVKLAPSLGMALGWLSARPTDTISLVIYAILIASFGGAVAGMAIAKFVRKTSVRGAEIPFGPALVIGTIVMVVIGPSVLPAVR